MPALYWLSLFVFVGEGYVGNFYLVQQVEPQHLGLATSKFVTWVWFASSSVLTFLVAWRQPRSLWSTEALICSLLITIMVCASLSSSAPRRASQRVCWGTCWRYLWKDRRWRESLFSRVFTQRTFGELLALSSASVLRRSFWGLSRSKLRLGIPFRKLLRSKVLLNTVVLVLPF